MEILDEQCDRLAEIKNLALAYNFRFEATAAVLH